MQSMHLFLFRQATVVIEQQTALPSQHHTSMDTRLDSVCATHAGKTQLGGFQEGFLRACTEAQWASSQTCPSKATALTLHAMLTADWLSWPGYGLLIHTCSTQCMSSSSLDRHPSCRPVHPPCTNPYHMSAPAVLLHRLQRQMPGGPCRPCSHTAVLGVIVR